MNNLLNENTVLDGVSRLVELRARIETAKARSPLASGSVIIVGASKQQPESVVRAAITAGLTHFGENRVQEAETKWPLLKQEFPDLRLHLIGPLQTNKAKDAVALFDCIETLDREKLCDAVCKACEKTGRNITCLIQVNTGEEPQKAGVAPAHADALIAYARGLNLPLTGLMCVPPDGQNPAPHFALLHEIAKRNDLHTLSMGMSDDFEIASRFGATHVRLGRVLFGERR